MSKQGIDYTAVPRTARLARYTTWNILGMTLPMVAALFAIPLLIRGLGDERFGVLSLVWMLVGYFSIFDFGLGRALTKMTAEKLGQARQDDVPSLFWTSMLMMGGIGLLGAVIIAAISPWLADSALKIAPHLRLETRHAFYLVAVSTPIVVTTVGLIGMLEAHQQFGLLNAIRLPMGLFTFIGPLLVLPFTQQLPAVVAVLLAGRIAICVLYLIAVLRVNPALRRVPAFDSKLIRPLLTFGGWMTVSNIVLPMMLHLDRLLIGALVSVAAVAYYTSSSEVVIKLLILPRSWVSALFPAFAAHFESRFDDTQALFARSVKYLMILMFPLVLLIVAFAYEGLHLWLGPEYAAASAPVMKVLTSGMFIYSLAFIPYSFLQSIGKPNLSALAHLVELPLFLAAAWGLTRMYGIQGTAWAWLLRAGVDLVLMFAFSLRFVPGAWGVVRRMAVAVLLAGGALWLVQSPAGLGPRLALFLGLAVAWSLLCWVWLLAPNEREGFLRLTRLQRGASAP